LTALNSIDKYDEENEGKEVKKKDDEINDEVVMRVHNAKVN